MACRIILLIAAGATMAAPAVALDGERDLSGYTYNHYVKEFRSGNALTATLDSGRRGILKENLKRIQDQNADPSKTWFATVNEFTDLTHEEFQASHTMMGHRGGAEVADRGALGAEAKMDLSALPDHVDWREKNVMTEPKNQGGCGSCWAFSVVETLESHYAIATGEAVPILSEQQLVDCMKNPDECGGIGGCRGATQPLGFNYTRAGVPLESDYSYEAHKGWCRASKVRAVVKNDGYVNLKVNDYNSHISALATQGPLSISLAAGAPGWHLYGGGIFGEKDGSKCGFDMNHAVQLVGYGTDKGDGYWLIRNSWGPGWGEHGYMRIARNGDGKEPCGIQSDPAHGEGCKGDHAPRTYCGVCGLLGSSSYPTGLTKVSEQIVV